MDTAVQQRPDLAKSGAAADSALAASTAARQVSANVQSCAAAQTGTIATGASSMPPTPRTRIYYNPELAEFSLGEDHPMVPHRLHLTHRLAELWGLFDDPAVQVIQDYPPATTDQLRRFHTDEYVAFLEYIDTLDLANMTVEQQQSLLGEDLALFGLSVCRPPGSGQEEDDAGPALAAGPGPGSASARSEGRQQQQQRQRVKAEGEQAARQAAGFQQGARQEAKPALGALVPWGSGAGGAGGSSAAAASISTEPLVPPQVVTLAIHLLAKLTPQGSAPLTAAQQQQLLLYLRQHHLQYQQRNPQPAARALAPAGPARPTVTMVRPGQAPPAGGKAAQQAGGAGGGGGGSNKKRKQDSGKGQGSGKGKRKSKSRKRRSSYSDDDDEEEEISDEDDDSPMATAEVPAAALAPIGCSARPSRQAATAVAALTNAVRATEAEESEDDDSEDDDDDDDDDEGGDCPIFPGLLRYVGLQAAGSILAARDLASGVCDVAVHWGGGMHHGMPYRAFGFCYVNDLVLAILELMAVCGRVLYIDIDVHHGDGVETAFKRSEKVMSISLHKWDDGRMQASIDTLNHGKPQRPVFFPGTGKKNDLGEGSGKYYTVNVPLQDDITDESYLTVYRAVVKTAFERFKPQAVVLQCGCDSVAGDKLGRFNLSIRGHSKCVELVRDLCRNGGCEGPPPSGAAAGRGGSSWRIPLLVTGGGGYTPPLVARCWALETAVLVGRELGETMPPSVMQAPDLVDLGPSYFKEADLSRPPKGPYSMCLDTIMLPGTHKQMDSDYSLSRLAGYLTSNMQRITIKESNPPAAIAAAAAAPGGDHAAEDDGAEPHHPAGTAEGAKDAAAPAAAAAAAVVSSKSRSRKSAAAAASGPGVADPLRHLTAPTGYPDAEEYIAEQKERVAAGAPWAAKMPPPPAPKGRKAIAAAAAAAAAAATAAKPSGGTALASVRSHMPTTAPGLVKSVGGASGVAIKQEGTAVAAGIPQIPVMPYIPGLPTILPYKPKVSVTTGGSTPAAAPSAAK